MSDPNTDVLPSRTSTSADVPRVRTEPKRSRRLHIPAVFSKLSGVMLLAVVVLVFGLLIPETFLTFTNLRSILAAQAIVAIVAIGVLFPLAAGAFDLSAAQNLGFSAVLCGWLLERGDVPVVIAVLATLAVGALIGMLNGTLVAVVGINSFIATLGSTSLLLAGTQLLAGGSFLGPFDTAFLGLTSGSLFGLPFTLIYVAVIALVAWYALEHSPMGRRLYATGANADAARLSGVATSRTIFGTLVVSGTVASAAGILLASTLGAVSQTMGPEYLLPAYSAAFLGTVLFKSGQFSVGGTLLAILLLGTGVQGLQLMGGPVWMIALFNGVALIVAVGAVLVLRRMQARRAVKNAARRAV